MEFTFVARTDTGRVRTLNEDSILAETAPQDGADTRGDLLVVADGMGGHQSGEVASQQAITTIRERYFRVGSESAIDALVAAIEAANRAVYERAEREGRQGMGTTVVAAARIGEQLHIAHVGDSRLYLVRDGQIQKLTHDHSLVEEQIAAGIITAEEAERHPHRNVISRSVGTLPDVEVEIAPKSPLILHDGDRLIICSDGLTEHVKPARILEIVQAHSSEVAVDELVRAANAAGGTDNISVIVAQAGEREGEESSTIETTPINARGRHEAPEAPDNDGETKPLPRMAAPNTGNGPGLPIALLGILAVLAAVAILALIAMDFIDQINEEAVPITVTATLQNNLVATITLSSDEATAESGALATAYPQATLSPNPTDETAVTPTPTPSVAPTVSLTPSE